MSFEDLFEMLGEGGTVILGGVLVGLAFGALSQRSRFCMRAAVVETFRTGIGPKTAIWLLAFAAAIVGCGQRWCWGRPIAGLALRTFFPLNGDWG